jgi:glycerol kinase
VTTYLLWHLTRGEVHAVDPTHAARLLLMNLRTLDWDPELLDLFGVPDSMLPRILPTVSDFGRIRLKGRTVDVRASVGDQQAALAGLGAVRRGEAVVNYGTGGFLLVNAGPKPVRPAGMLSSLAWTTPDETVYAVEGTVNAVGPVFDWLAGIGWIESQKETGGLAGTRNGEVYFVPAFTGLGSPYWESEVRAALLGIGPATTRADLARSAVEGIAFLVKDIEAAIRRDGRLKIKKLTAGGGGARFHSLVQTQADWLGIPIRLSSETEATARGAGLLAGLGCGWWESPLGFPEPRRERLFRPRLSEGERGRLYRNWKRAVEAARRFRTE